MNIENVKQVFGSPATGSDKPTAKNNLLPIVIGIIAVVGIAVYLIEKKKERLRKEAEENN